MKFLLPITDMDMDHPLSPEFSQLIVSNKTI